MRVVLDRDSDDRVMTTHAVGAAPLWLGGAANCGPQCAPAPGARPRGFPDESPLLSAIGRRRARMMEYSVGRGVACCGLLCFHVGEFGNSALLVFKGDPASVGGPKARRLCFK